MPDGVESFVERGGNLAFFAANVCWWRIHLADGGATMVCHQGGPRGVRETGGHIVQHAGHWVFAGTGLHEGDTFGRRTWPPLPGYECDGVPLDGFEGGKRALLPSRTRDRRVERITRNVLDRLLCA